MLIFLKEQLVLYAVPKTGSSALEAALKPRCSIALQDPPELRHMTSGRFAQSWGPFFEKRLGANPTSVAILREPVSRLASWYRYRHANQFQGTENGISHISFDDFIAATLSKDPPVWARIGSQDRFALDAHDAPRITDLFVYESLPRAIGFLEQKLGAPIVLPQKNVSPKRATPLRPDLLEALKQRRAREFRLYHAVAEAGHLVSR